VLEHRHLERYGDQTARMRTILDLPKGAEAVLRAYRTALTIPTIARRSKVA
jgi:hypothetical protein